MSRTFSGEIAVAYKEKVRDRARKLKRRFGLTHEAIADRLTEEFKLSQGPSVKTISRWMSPETRKLTPRRRFPRDPLVGHRHREHVVGLLTAASTELKRFLGLFPTAFQGFRPDHSDRRLNRVTVGAVSRVEWSLASEQLYGWYLVAKHLENGLPVAHSALSGVKEHYSKYCQQLIEIEDRLREEAQADKTSEGDEVTFNESHFFRSILGEVDKEDTEPSEGDYAVVPGPSQTSVAYDGTELLVASDRGVAVKWVVKHIGWRINFIHEYKRGLIQLRGAAVEQATAFVRCIEDMEMAGQVLGSCEQCPSRH